MYVEALGTRTLILNSVEAINELLLKRAARYSDRPTLVMVGELMHLEKVGGHSITMRISWGQFSCSTNRRAVHFLNMEQLSGSIESYTI